MQANIKTEEALFYPYSSYLLADDRLSDLDGLASTKKRSFISGKKPRAFASPKNWKTGTPGLEDSVRMEDEELSHSFESIEFDPFMDMERIERRERIDI